MKLKSIEDIETKYPGISDKDGWLDLHMKRGQSEISDDDFKLALLDFGMENADTDSYVILLQAMNESIEDLVDDSKTMEMIDIGLKYEHYYEKEPEVLKHLNTGDESAAKEVLIKEFAMNSSEIEDVIAHLKWRSKMEGFK